MWDRATNVIYASAMTREDHRSNLLFTFAESAFRSGVRSKQRTFEATFKLNQAADDPP